MSTWRTGLLGGFLGLMPLLPTSPMANAAVVILHTGAREPPPVAIEEHRAPRRGYVWVAGHHQWRHRHYVWSRGHYVRERRGYEFAPGRWDRHEDHYDWHDGEWHPHR